MTNINKYPSLSHPNLLFISLDWTRPKDLRKPLSTGSIETYFRKNQSGITSAEFIDFNLNDSSFRIEDIKDLISKKRPSFLALGAYIWNEKYVPDVVSWTKNNYPDTIIILGGPQVTYGNHNLSMEYPGVDYFVRGEGELPFTELIDDLSLNRVPSPEMMSRFSIYTPETLKKGVCNNSYVHNPEKLLSPYLNQILPIEQNQTFVRWETSRRCPYQCSFCQFRSPEDHKVVRLNHKRLFQELEYFKKKKVQEINVLDPIFNLNPKHYLEICRKIDFLRMNSRFYFQCRLELLCHSKAVEFLEFCRDRQIWLEFGVQTFKEKESEAINRGNKFDKIDKGIDLLHQFKIPFDLHLIFGLPFQSLDNFLWSYDKAKDANPNGLYLYPLNILKGTDLFVQSNEWDYDYDSKNNNIFLKSKWMTQHEVECLKEASEKINHQSKEVRNTKKSFNLPDLRDLL